MSLLGPVEQFKQSRRYDAKEHELYAPTGGPFGFFMLVNKRTHRAEYITADGACIGDWSFQILDYRQGGRRSMLKVQPAGDGRPLVVHGSYQNMLDTLERRKLAAPTKTNRLHLRHYLGAFCHARGLAYEWPAISSKKSEPKEDAASLLSKLGQFLGPLHGELAMLCTGLAFALPALGGRLSAAIMPKSAHKAGHAKEGNENMRKGTILL